MNLVPEAQEVLLQDAITRDRATARRAALFDILFHWANRPCFAELRSFGK